MIFKLSLQDKLADMLDKGKLVENGQIGILTQALGTPEHPVRVRNRGEYVKP